MSVFELLFININVSIYQYVFTVKIKYDSGIRIYCLYKYVSSFIRLIKMYFFLKKGNKVLIKVDPIQ